MKADSVIRTIYLYLFALLGLVLLTIGGVRFLDMGLKAFVFTKAEEEQRVYYKQPRVDYSMIERLEKVSTGDGEELSAEEKDKIKIMIADYEAWEEEVEKIDPITSRRHRDASINLSLLLIGLPLYLYHWSVIKKETKKDKK